MKATRARRRRPGPVARFARNVAIGAALLLACFLVVAGVIAAAEAVREAKPPAEAWP